VEQRAAEVVGVDPNYKERGCYGTSAEDGRGPPVTPDGFFFWQKTEHAFCVARQRGFLASESESPAWGKRGFLVGMG
jgi:hypothetical protein